jgi:hypothetical protein
MNTENKVSGAQEDGLTAMIEAKTSQILQVHIWLLL